MQVPYSAYTIGRVDCNDEPEEGVYIYGGLYCDNDPKLLNQREKQAGAAYRTKISAFSKMKYMQEKTHSALMHRRSRTIKSTFWTPSHPTPPEFYDGVPEPPKALRKFASKNTRLANILCTLPGERHAVGVTTHGDGTSVETGLVGKQDSQKKTEKPKTYRPKDTMSVMDFLPKTKEDDIDVLTAAVCDWEAHNNIKIIMIRTIETQWPEPSVYQMHHAGNVGHCTYWVRFIRVWYHSKGPPATLVFNKGSSRPRMRGFQHHPLPVIEPELKQHLDMVANCARGKNTEDVTSRILWLWFKNYFALPIAPAVKLDYVMHIGLILMYMLVLILAAVL